MFGCGVDRERVACASLCLLQLLWCFSFRLCLDHVKSSPFHCLSVFFVFCCRAVQRLLRLTAAVLLELCAVFFLSLAFRLFCLLKSSSLPARKKKGKNNMRLSLALIVAVVLFLACLTRGLEAASAPSAAASLSVSSSTETAPSQAASPSSTTSIRYKKWVPLSQLRQPASATGNSDEFTVSYHYRSPATRRGACSFVALQWD